MKKVLIYICLILLVVGCGSKKETKPVTLKMATTTSLNDTGLLDVLAKAYKDETGVTLQWVSVGSGEAINLVRAEEVDLLFAHSKKDEELLVKDGYSLNRDVIMKNNFLIVGPEKLPETDLKGILVDIKDNKLFVSRGDGSGTHKRELAIFDEMLDGAKPINYVESGSGMGATLEIADEKRGYTLVDYGTWLSFKDKLNLEVVYYDENELVNEYALHVVSKDKVSSAQEEEALKFKDWLCSEKTMKLIADYGNDTYNEPLFIRIK